MSDNQEQPQIPQDEPDPDASLLMQFTRLIHQRRAAKQPSTAAGVEEKMRKMVKEHKGDREFVRRAETLLRLEFLRESKEGGEMER